MFDMLGLCVLALMELSCSSDQNIKESHSIESFMNKPRVFYGETGDPCESDSRSENCESLSTKELGQIQTSISELTQESIWFVRVPLASSQRSRRQLWVYLIPDIANTRFRSGWAYTLRNSYWSKGPSVSPPWRYVQVSLPDKVFDPNLETPDVHDLPFQYPPRDRKNTENEPDFLSQEDIIRLMDYVRKPEVYLELKKRKTIPKEHPPAGEARISSRTRRTWREDLAEKIVSLPIVSIRKKNDEITITLGFVHNGLFARRYIVKVRATEQGFQYITFSMFIS